MQLGVQFRGSVAANGTGRWLTHSWPEQWRVVWMIVPTAPIQDRSPQLEWKVQTERQASNLIKYHLEIKNLTPSSISVEARYAILD